MASVPTITLNNGVEIPQLGFGTYQVPPEDTKDRVLDAFEAGYRHIDTAQMYGNEQGVGEALAASGLARDDVFVTTKLNNDNHEPDRVHASLEESLKKLGLERLDLFLIHWPLPAIDIDFVDTWKAMEEAYRAGKTRAIGVSNFQAHHLRRLIGETTIIPAVNQIEVHPFLTQDDLRAVNAEHEVATEAWSPLAQGQVFENEAINAIAESIGRAPAQVVLRWAIQRGDIVFPKASSPERVAQNFDLFGFELSDADMASISALNEDRRVGPDPDTFNYVP
ncbi:aldo/keto reductase [Aeromicrobium sp. YIM 150415]|uniref:aldo/keto reductase n=1 Tax=Aeromicrobium sp. YIM 150415 TaxID=2803912 RepID=UPI0019646344|nr:aldo/keto reductase [Aeromicrobium sp. YIM 150415]MBM9464482.1 aldo/keto reductase [Aeromicrobium sp. YIM 150415]